MKWEDPRIYCYILDKSKMDWLESENLFLHDIALLIENTEKKAYLYSGPKTSKSEHELGMELAQKIIQKFNYELIILEDSVPLKIQAEIDLLLGDNIDPRNYKEERTIWMILLMIMGIIGSGIYTGMFINNLRMIGWKQSSLTFGTSAEIFDSLFSVSIILLWVCIGVFGLMILFSIGTQRAFLITSAIIVEAVSIGTLLYLQKGIFLFGGAPEEISRLELLLHYLWLGIALLGILFVCGWILWIILHQTEIRKKEEVSLEEIRKSSHPTILRDKPPVEMKEIEKQ